MTLKINHNNFDKKQGRITFVGSFHMLFCKSKDPPTQQMPQIYYFHCQFHSFVKVRIFTNLNDVTDLRKALHPHFSGFIDSINISEKNDTFIKLLHKSSKREAAGCLPSIY